MKRFFTLAAVVLSLGLATPARAQQATVTGTVADATGALIPGAEVTATNNNTGVSTLRVSGETGNYSIPGLQPGPYSIVASLPGFSDATIQVNLTPNDTFRFNFTMQVGAVATAVEVVSDADALLATTGASVGDALPENEVVALPLQTRDVFDLLNSTAGLVRRGGGDATNFVGTRNSAVNTTRDGVPVSDGRYLDWNGAFSATFSSPDLVEEVQISVGTVDAAAGRGSSQVRLQTRSGTNEFHGALFYGSNNSALNANGWFNNLRGEERDWTNRNQFGGRIGGPIIRNKAFFFVLIDNQRYLTRNNVTGTVWTADARQGRFRYWPGVNNDDALGGAGASVDLSGNPTRPAGATGDLQTIDLFADVQDPHRGTGISSNAYIQETLRRMPQPNNFTTGDGLNTAAISWVRRQSGIDNAAGTSQNTNRDNLNVRFDYQISDSHKVAFIMSREYNFNDASQPAWPDGLVGLSTRDPRIYTITYDATVSPTVLNEFRFGYRSTSWHGRPPYAEGCCFGDNLSLFEDVTPEAEEAQAFFEFSGPYPWLPATDSLGGTLWMTVPTFTTIRSQNSPLWTFSDNVSWVVGSHSFTAGWEGTWADSDGWNTGGMEPRVAFGNGNFPATANITGRFAGLTNTDANRAGEILNDLSGSVGNLAQAFVVNDPSRGFDDILTTIKQTLNYHQNDWAAFFKDDWNVSQNLTLNYGVRWDVYGVPYEEKGLNGAPKDGNFLGISGNGELTEFIPVGRNSLNPDLNLYPKDWNNLAPSLGFSYRVPWMDRTTVVRGGYGISYAGAATFLQYDFGPGRVPGKSYGASVTPATYTAAPGSTNPNATPVQFPLDNPIEPFGTPGAAVIPLTDRRVNAYFYAPDRRVPYIQNFNFRIETELAANTNLSVAWVGTKGTALWGGRQLNEPEIFNNGFLDAFVTTREGGNAPLFDSMFNGINFGGATCGVVNGTTCTGSMVLRQAPQTRADVANGEAADLAEYVNQTNAFTGEYGGLLRANGYPENFIVVNPQFNFLDLYDNGDSSSYHSLQTQITKRLSSGYSGQFTYTWSKALGNAATQPNVNREDQSFGTRDPNNRNLQKGLVPFHRTHAFNAHGVWSLPFGPGRLIGSGAPGWIHRVIEGWQLSSIVSWSSGSPLPVTSGLQTLAAEVSRNTPDLVGGMAAFPKSTGGVVVGDDGEITYLTGFTRVAEPAADYYGSNPDGLERFDNLWQIVDDSGAVVLRNPKPGTTGDLSYNWLEGPGGLGLDASLQKSVQIREGTDFTIRFDAINVLNTPLWGNPNTDINSVNFGRITNAGGARTFTMNARIDF